MRDTFLMLKTIYFTGYADDNKTDNKTDVIKALEEIGENLANRFSNNETKLNIDKCHLLLNCQEPNAFKKGDLHIKTLSVKNFKT